MVGNYNICAAHSVKTVLDSFERKSHCISVITDSLRVESKKMLREQKLTESQAHVTINHTFNIEAISRVLRNLKYSTKYLNITLQNRIAGCMILSNGHHWISITPNGNFLSVYTDNQRILFSGDEKAVKQWLKRKKFISGLEIFILSSCKK